MTIETANRLVQLRKQHNLSQEELAEKLGVSRQAVSKWERSEASPDTDNLIALAKIYSLSLDELVFGDGKAEEKPSEENAETSGDTTKVKIGPTGIYVESDDGDKVKIDLSGIKIVSSASELFDDDEEDDNNDDEDDDITIIDENHIKITDKKGGSFWRNVPYPIICAALYLLFGCYNIIGGWANAWIIFLTIPIYYSIIDVILKKRLSAFDYPIFAVLIYLYIGLYHGNWHPSWIIFLTILVFDPIAKWIDKTLRTRKKDN